MIVLRMLFVLLLLAPALLAQEKVELRANIDLAAFRYDKEMSFVELYYSFSRGALKYSQANGQYSGSVLMHSVLRNVDSQEEPILKSWRIPVQLKDTAGLADKLLVGKVTFLLEPGRYNVALISRDEAAPQVADSVEVNYVVRSFAKADGVFSDLELCSSVQRIEADSANIFYKNTLEVIPNPTLLYGKASPRVMYYCELYEGKLDPFLIKTEVVSSYGRTMLAEEKERSGVVPSRVEVGAVPVASYPTGQYTLILSYAKPDGSVHSSQSKPFYVYNPDIPIDTTAILRAVDAIAYEFAALSEEELDEEFRQAQYSATAEERDLWDALDGAESKRKYLTKFWSERDPDTATPFNEAYDEYKQRILSANEKFRTAFRDGWRTDRGRVYVLYGPPDYVERIASDSEMKPSEIWRYDYIEAGVEFIFLDRNGFGNFELVHSTKRGETYNEDWQRLGR